MLIDCLAMDTPGFSLVKADLVSNTRSVILRILSLSVVGGVLGLATLNQVAWADHLPDSSTRIDVETIDNLEETTLGSQSFPDFSINEGQSTESVKLRDVLSQSSASPNNWSDIELPEGTLDSIKSAFDLPESQQLALSISQLLQLADGQNIEVKRGQENVKEKKATYWLALSDLLPDVTLGVNQSRFVGQIQGFGSRNFNISQTTVRPSVGLNYIVYTGGDNLFRIGATKHRRDAQESQLESTRQTVLAQVAKTYYELKRAYWARSIALQGMEEAQLEMDITQTQYQNGIGIKLDVLRAQSDFEAQSFNRVDAELNIAQQANRLNQLLAMDPDINIVPDQLETAVVPLIDESLDVHDLTQIALEHNPDLQFLTSLQEASVSEVRAKIASYMPQVALSATFSAVGPEYEKLGRNYFAGFQATFDLLQNLGTDKPLKIMELQAIRHGLERTLDLETARVKEQIYNQTIGLKAKLEQIKLARKRYAIQREAFYFAIGRLKEGVGTSLQVQNALTDLTQARVDLLNAFIGYNQTQIDLLRSMGVISPQTLTKGYQAHAS